MANNRYNTLPLKRSNKIMALILAAGLSNRLRRLTRHKPKALLAVAGVPILFRILNALKQIGVKEVFIVTGYRGEYIRKRIGKFHSGLKINYIYNSNFRKGNLYSLLAAKHYIKENFLLLMSDHIYDTRILKGLINCNLKGTVMIAADRRKPLPEDTKILERNNRIISIGKKIRGNCIDTGAFLCSPEIFSYAERAAIEGERELSSAITAVAADGGARIFDITEIPAYLPEMRRELKPFWTDIDTEEDIKNAENLIIENSGKGRGDFLTALINRPIENRIVKFLVKTSIKPNKIKILTNIIAYAATLLFLKGYFFAASFTSFITSLMSAVNAKLSTVKGMNPEIEKMDHPFEFLFEHSWYIAFSFAIVHKYGMITILLGMFIILLDAFSEFCRQTFNEITGIPLDDYGRTEKIFRKFDGRKNNYIFLIFTGVVFKIPFYSLAAILSLSAISAIFYSTRAIWNLYNEERKSLPMAELMIYSGTSKQNIWWTIKNYLNSLFADRKPIKVRSRDGIYQGNRTELCDREVEEGI